MLKKACNLTVGQWVDYWTEIYDKPSVRPSTFQAHGYIMRNHIIPLLGDIPLAKLTEGDVGRFLAKCKSSGNHCSSRTGSAGLSDETIRHIHRLLHHCLARAVNDELIGENPAGQFNYENTIRQTPNVLTADEVSEYLDAAEELGVLPMFTLAVTSGLRQGELIALKWSDLDIENRTLTIAKQRVVECGKLVSYMPESLRVIPLPAQTVELLIQEHDRHPSSPCMFVHAGTLKPYSPGMVRLLHRKIIRRSELDHIRFMDLRHTYAVLALENGMDVRTLSAVLGHCRIALTRKAYGAYWKGPKAIAAERREASFHAQRIAADKIGALVKW